MGRVARPGWTLDAARIAAVEFTVVPTLAQAADYSRHLFRVAARAHGASTDLDSAVTERIRRQSALYNPDQRVEILIGEAALRLSDCPQAVIRAQAARLVALLGLRRVRIGVIPADAELPTITKHGYTILDDQVVVEIDDTEFTITDPHDVALYERITTDLWRVAMVDDALRALLRRLGR